MPLKVETKPGRPPLPPADRRDKQITIRVTEEELQMFISASVNETISDWARAILLRSAKRTT